MNADYNRRNQYGANVLHIAAQGDQPVPLYYFVTEKGMGLDETDNRGSTPLHWACYSRSEFALSYILALNPNLELQDHSGFTALHLAIKSVPELKTTRPVRALLIRGAKRSPVSKAGLTTLQMIKEDLPQSMKMDLQNMLKEPKYIECFMVKTPMVKLRRNHKTQILFATLFCIIIFAQIFIIVPSKYFVDLSIQIRSSNFLHFRLGFYQYCQPYLLRWQVVETQVA